MTWRRFLVLLAALSPTAVTNVVRASRPVVLEGKAAEAMFDQAFRVASR